MMNEEKMEKMNFRVFRIGLGECLNLYIPIKLSLWNA